MNMLKSNCQMYKINKIYTRKDIGEILGTSTKGGNWATGYTTFNDELYIFTTIDGAGRTGHNYHNKFLENDILEWHGKMNSHVNQPLIKRIINNDIKVYIFIRYNDKTQFTYIGLGRCIKYFDESPVRIYFDYEKRNLELLEMENIEKIEDLEKISITEKESIIKSRIGHSKLKELLLNNIKECQLCNIKKEELLIASHIKPWSKSNSQERLDLNNVLLLCPLHDSLFDKGFISFSDDGKIIISNVLSEKDILSLNLSEDLRINLKEEQKKYMKYHRENILKIG